jgi:hypothetical protein
MSAAETALTEKNNSNVSSPQSAKRKWLADVFVIVFCVSGAAFSLNMFRLDLFQSLASQNKKPMGTVTIKYNNVQRRFSDRVLWSRLTVDSPVYLGDLIRVAEYSAATLNINDGVIDINENSLIRIRASSDGEARIVIDLNSGSLSITGSDSADGGVALNVMGRIVAPTAKGTLSVLAGESGITLQVNEGSAIITGEDGQSRSMDAGEALILNNQGVEQAAPMAVVMMPRPNARFIKNSVEPLNIRFTWNVINIDQQQPLRLEIAAGPNFTRIVRTAEGVNFSNVALGAGTWYWRLSYQDTVLSSGQFTIVDAAISSSTSPLKDSIDYRENMPIRFEWQSIEEASYYILEASLTPDIKNPSITRQTAIASYVETSMKAGDWYWRVKPVFSSVYEGTTVFSQVASFRIEKNEEPAAVVQTADDSAIMPTQPEAETKSADNSKTKKSDKSTNPAKPADSAASDNLVNPVTPPVSDTATLADPISDTDIFILPTAGWKTITDNNGSRSNINIAGEIIDGKEINVLTISSILAGGTSRWTGATLTEENFITKVLHLYSRTTGTTAADIILIQKLANANGVRFKILGDGKKWEVYFPTTDVNDGAYHGLTISTQNGEVSNIDVPFNKLTQPSYGMRIRFNKNKLKGITIQKSDNIGSGTAASTIKIFDFEVY